MKVLKIILIVLAMIAIVLGVFLMFSGSLEMFPTDEQQQKARIAAAVYLVFGVIVGSVGLLLKPKR